MTMKRELWLEIYKTRQINRKHFDTIFERNGNDERWYICYAFEDPERDDSIQYDACIDPKLNILEDLSVTKFGERWACHGRPSFEERELTSAEKKAARETFDDCFISSHLDELEEVINKAIVEGSSFNGNRIIGVKDDNVVYQTKDNKKKKVAKDKVLKALDCAHLDLSIIKEPEGELAQEFKKSFGSGGYEAVYAIINTLDPTTFSNYQELEENYVREQLQKAVRENNVEYIDSERDFIRNYSGEALAALLVPTYSIPDQKLLDWMMKNISGDNAKYLFTVILREAIGDDQDTVARKILKLGLFDTDAIDSESYKAPMWEACFKKKWNMVDLLVKNGFYLSQKNGSEYYKTKQPKQLAALLDYRVDMTKDALERLIRKKDSAILDRIEEKYTSPEYQEVLLQLYVKYDCFERFYEGLEKGFPYEAPETVSACFEKGGRWQETLLRYPIDVNKDDGKYLSEAVVNRQYDMVKYLLEHGADVNLHGKYGGTALYKAVSEYGYGIEKKPDERICQLLIEAGADLLDTESDIPVLNYAFHISAEFSCFLIDWLDEKGLMEEIMRTKYGRETPLMIILGDLYHLQDRMKRVDLVIAKLEEKGIDTKPFLEKYFSDNELRDIFIYKKKRI